jgi:hypothetical protein
MPFRKAAPAAGRSMTDRPGVVIFVAVLAACVLAASPATQSIAAGTAHGEALEKMADEVAKEVEQLRGWTFKHPVKKERISVTQAKADVRRMLLTGDTSEHRARVQAFLRVVGLIPADCDLVTTSLTVLDQQVAGYYEPATRTLRLVDRPVSTPPFVERMILAHELTHALDDQYIDLADLMKPGIGTEDAEFVATALGEGSATALMLQHMFAAQQSGRFSVGDLAQYMAEELARAKTLEQLPRFFSAMFGSYVVGAAFLAKGELTGLLTQPDNHAVGEALLAARRSLPRSSEQLLHVEKYWDASHRDEPVVFDDKAIDRWLGRSGRHVLHRDTLGELLTAILTVPRDAARDIASLQSVSSWTNAGAAGWGGDRFYLLADSDSPATLQTTKALQGVWLSAWDTPKDRDEFLVALDKGSPAPNSISVPFGRQLAVVFVAIPPAERDALVRRLGLMPVPMTRGGRAWVQ